MGTRNLARVQRDALAAGRCKLEPVARHHPEHTVVRRVGLVSAFSIGAFMGWTASIIVAFALSKNIDKALRQHAIKATED
jgi:hypothetical protein